MFESRFPARAGNGVVRVGWVVLSILVIVTGALIMVLPVESPTLVWQKIVVVSDTITKKQLPTVKVVSKPAPGARVFEDGRFVTYVYYNGRAFIPENIVINSGEEVRFVNLANLAMRVASRPENVSSVAYSLLNQPNAEGKGSEFTTIFSEPGVWSYENLTSTNPRILGNVYVR